MLDRDFYSLLAEYLNESYPVSKKTPKQKANTYSVKLPNGVILSGNQKDVDQVFAQLGKKQPEFESKTEHPEKWHWSETKKQYVYLPDAPTAYLKNILLKNLTTELEELRADSKDMNNQDFSDAVYNFGIDNERNEVILDIIYSRNE